MFEHLMNKHCEFRNCFHTVDLCDCNTFTETVVLCCRSLSSELVPLSSRDVTVLVVNSNVRHELSVSEYPLRRQQCERAASLLNCHKLRDATIADVNGTMFCFVVIKRVVV